MLIGTLARATGVSVRMLRHYEAQGLIGSQRCDNRYREFDRAAIEQVAWIRDLIDCGFSTRQIAPMIACLRGGADTQAAAEGLALHRRKLAELDTMIGELSDRRARLRHRLAHFDRPGAAQADLAVTSQSLD